MNSLAISVLNISTGIILLKNKIAAHTYHIRIQSQDFSQIQSVTGSAIDIYQSNPHYDLQPVVQQYAFWDYEPVHHIADIAITICCDHEEKKWIENLQQGDTLFFRLLCGSWVPDQAADHYILISDVKALSQLYEINRALPVSKKVTAVAYAEQEDYLFPDLDQSFPVKTFLIFPTDPVKILEWIMRSFRKDIQNAVIYVLGDSPVASFIYHDLKDQSLLEIQTVYLNPF
ncbi:hypothetical protein ACQ7CU_08305 [Chryseobacterium arthrosphaerae]|uniref:hypothetical protein n=1 Tax=Chryseobacterium arthrosphaerae TaxID=651561 RepID=UPI003D32C447